MNDDSTRDDSQRRSASPAHRWLRRSLWLLLLIEVLYLVGANVYLGSDLAPRTINRKPEKLLIEWQKAWSPLPGLILVRGIEIRGQNRSLQWYTRLERARIWMRLLPLASRRFQAHSVNGEGLRFLLARREDRPLADGQVRTGETGADSSAPPIPGLENPPDPAPEQTYPPVPADRPGWVVRLNRIDVDGVEELWVDRYRYRGKGRVAGTFGLQVRGELEVESSKIDLLGGTLEAGGHVVAEPLDARARLELAPLAPREAQPRDLLQRLSGTLRTAARVESLRFANAYLDGAPWLRIDGHGRLDSNLVLRDGRLVEGTTLTLDAERIETTLFEHAFRGNGTLRGQVSGAGSDSTAEIAVHIDSFEVQRRTGAQAHVRGENFEVTIACADPALVGGFQDLQIDLRLPQSQVTAFDAYAAYLPADAGLALRGGHGRLTGELSLSTRSGSGRGRVRLDGQDVVLQADDAVLVGDVDLELKLTRIDRGKPFPQDVALALGGSSVRLRHVRVEGDPSTDGDWWADLDFDAGRVVLRDPFLMRADVAAAMRDTRPIVAVFAEKNQLVDWFERLFKVQDVRGTATVELTPAAMALDDLHLRGEGLEVDGSLRMAKSDRRGLLFAKVGVVSAAVELFPDGRRDWKLIGSRRWFEERSRKPETRVVARP